jgi:hypothetical protein|tara:strand:- start:1961 stop:2251 length:291 start_codon:yes stop_codon:yes gene_type:complete
MNNENYEKLLNKHINEGFDGITRDLLNRHIYELTIFPKENEFKVGEYVSMYEFEEYGYIEKFNLNGTMFIKKNFSDMGSDYSFNFVKKIEKNSFSK